MTLIPAAPQFENRSRPEDVAAAKALFMTEVAHIIGEGRGEITRLESGILEFRLGTGEIYHLGDWSITRIV
jgi:hypothetical protein